MHFFKEYQESLRKRNQREAKLTRRLGSPDEPQRQLAQWNVAATGYSIIYSYKIPADYTYPAIQPSSPSNNMPFEPAGVVEES